MRDYYRVYANIDLDAIYENVVNAKKLTKPGTKLMAIIKADAYGHGAVEVARTLDDVADAYGVAILEEGIDLRQAGIRLDTHIIGQRQADKQGLDQSLYHNPQRLVMSIEISDHAKQHRCYDGLQCEAPQIIISFLNNDSISCKDSCQKISFKHYKDKYDTCLLYTSDAADE